MEGEDKLRHPEKVGQHTGNPIWQQESAWLGRERKKERLAQLTAAQRSAEQQRLVSWLGPASESYLRRLADTDRSLTRQVRELLLLVREYGPEAVAAAVTQAHAAGAFGADYIANLLRQQRMRHDVHAEMIGEIRQLPSLKIAGALCDCFAKMSNHSCSNSRQPLMLGAMVPWIAADAPVVWRLPGGANQFVGGSCTRCSPAPFMTFHGALLRQQPP